MKYGILAFHMTQVLAVIINEGVGRFISKIYLIISIFEINWSEEIQLHVLYFLYFPLDPLSNFQQLLIIVPGSALQVFLKIIKLVLVTLMSQLG